MHAVNSKILPLPTPLKALREATFQPYEQTLFPWIHGAAGITIILGGTSTRAVCKYQGKTFIYRIKWEEFEQYDSSLHNATGFVRVFTRNLARFLFEQHAISPEAIREVRCSVAGGVDDGKITTTNAGVTFRNYPLAERILKELEAQVRVVKPSFKFAIRDVAVMNDGFAAALGEALHPEGAFRQSRKGIAIIIGTGLGSGGVDLERDKAIIPEINEFGHTFLYDTMNKVYTHCSLEELKRQGLVLNHRFKGTPDNATYAEHRLAGPWAAIRFVKGLMEDDDVKIELGRYVLKAQRLLKLGDEGKDTFEPNDDQIRQMVKTLDRLGELPRENQERWSIGIKDSLIMPINQVWMGTMVEDHSISELHRTPSANLVEAGYQFKKKYIRELASFLDAVRKKFPGYPIALVSGVAENLGKDRNFLPILRKHLACEECDVIVSTLDAIERETAGVGGDIVTV